MLLLAALTGVVCGCESASQGQGPAAANAAPRPTRLYFGIAACRQCHTKPGDAEPLLCRCIEATVWETEDKHKDAFQALHSERAREMGELLRFKGPVWEEKSCVSCHGVYIEDKSLRHRTFKEEDGVSCVACHGAYKEWVALHGDVLERDAWRSHSRKLKEEKYGMRDLWDPVGRARLCASCHVGNTAEGKVVTHAMYGAGHPPLPSVEVATFSEAMPRHWQYLKEKTPEIQKMLLADPGEAAFEQTKLVAVGSVVVLREELNLLASQAALAIPETDPKVIWPELAHFDCASCHHELVKPVWRPRPGATTQPGRPPLRRWPAALAEIILGQADDQAKTAWRQQLQGIGKSLEARPFGKPSEIAPAARQAVAWLDQRLPALVSAKYDRAAALRLLRRLGSLGAEELPDFDSARQRAWAFQIVYQELGGALGAKPVNDQAIQQILQTLEPELVLKLPAGRKQRIEEQLKPGLQKREDYGPAQLKQAFAKLVSLLPEK